MRHTYFFIRQNSNIQHSANCCPTSQRLEVVYAKFEAGIGLADTAVMSALGAKKALGLSKYR